jgi:hypothetical protein
MPSCLNHTHTHILLTETMGRKEWNKEQTRERISYCSYRALSIIKSHNIQRNKTHCIVSRYSILQYLVSQSHKFRSLMWLRRIVSDSYQSIISQNTTSNKYTF